MDSETLKQLHQVQIEILCEIDRICKLHSIMYFLDSGSALGAIRHQGFIPWDDDIDIAMLREDYDLFCEIAPRELKNDFFFQSLKTDVFYNKLHIKIRKNNTKYIEESGGNPKMHNGVFIDIVPFDKVPTFAAKLSRSLPFMFQRLFVYNYEKDFLKPNFIKSFISGIIAGRNTLKRYNRLCKMFSKMRSGFSYVAFDYPDYQRYIFPSSLFGGIVEKTFENKQFPVIAGFDEYLKIMYGDYMQLPPEEDRRTHDIINIEL